MQVLPMSSEEILAAVGGDGEARLLRVALLAVVAVFKSLGLGLGLGGEINQLF